MSLPDWKPQPDNRIELPDACIDLWLIDLNPADFQFPSSNNTILAQNELERAGRFRFDKHRRQYVAGRRGLRQILAKYTGCRPADIQFEYGEHGKPSLVNQPVEARVEFNLSNTNDTALVAVAKGMEVGADIEYVGRKMWDIDSLAQTVFTDSEIEELGQYRPDDRLVPFLSGWTRKEAYLKGIGKGLALPLKDFSVRLKNEEDFPSISAPEWQLFSFWSDPDHISAIAYPERAVISTFRWFRLPATG